MLLRSGKRMTARTPIRTPPLLNISSASMSPNGDRETSAGVEEQRALIPERTVDQLRKQLDDMERIARLSSEEASTIQKELQIRTGQLETAEAELLDRTRQLEAAEAKIAKYHSQVNQKSAEVMQLTSELRDAKARIDRGQRDTSTNDEVSRLLMLNQALTEQNEEYLRRITELSRTQFRDTYTQSRQNNTFGFNLKSDDYDGTSSLREFLIQFQVVAKANNWSTENKTVALISCLKGKARSVLVESDASSLDYENLVSRLELRFGDKHMAPTYYSQFQDRRQQLGEDLQTVAADIERLSALVYPECSFEVQDKIACSQFIRATFDASIREILRLERITSLKVALARAMEVKAIREMDGRPRNTRNYSEVQRKGFNSSDTQPRISHRNQDFMKNIECWQCGKKGHYSFNCQERSKSQGN